MKRTFTKFDVIFLNVIIAKRLAMCYFTSCVVVFSLHVETSSSFLQCLQGNDFLLSSISVKF